jgi:hypothetical protein
VHADLNRALDLVPFGRGTELARSRFLDADPGYLCRSNEAPSLLNEPGESFSSAREVGRGMNVMILSVAAVVDDGAPKAILVADNAGRSGHKENISRKASCVKDKPFAGIAFGSS